MSPEPRLPIETARLRLRRLVPGDLAVLHAMHSREDVTRWLYWDPRTEDEVRASLDAHIARSFDEGIVLAIDRTGEMIGTANLALGEHRQGELGFMLHPDHQGHGYATEAAAAILELAFGTYGLHRVHGSVEPRNTASVRVLERLGMRKEAHLIENAWGKGEWSSEAIYAILARRLARSSRASLNSAQLVVHPHRAHASFTDTVAVTTWWVAVCALGAVGDVARVWPMADRSCRARAAIVEPVPPAAVAVERRGRSGPKAKIASFHRADGPGGCPKAAPTGAAQRGWRT